jgi:pimeloyl-ACP methyl ester carboxylesterase
MQPFRQLAFEDLPERPRLPHRWAEVETHERELDTESFGRVRTTWRTYGQGEPLLLVHGLMTAGYSWRYVLEPLGAHFQLVIPDLPGSGDTACPDRSYHPDRVADWIGEFAAAVGVRGCRTIGNSLGGYLCMRLALRDPGALGSLVNLHSPGVPLLRLRALRGVMSVPGSHRLLRWLVHRDPERWVHRNVHYYDESLKSREETRVWAAPLRSDDGVRAFGRILRESLDPGEMALFVAGLADRHARGVPFPVPLLLVYAATDPVVPPWVGERLHAVLPRAGFVRLEQASHFAHVDAVERFVPAVLPFLHRRDMGPPSQEP